MSRDEMGRIARRVAEHPYRRTLLCVLDSRAAPITIRDLARAILAYDRPATSAPSTDYTSVLDHDASDEDAVETMTAQLHHVHLPRLAAAGLVEYDIDESVVTDWHHPPVGDRWLTAPPIDRLARVIADARASPSHAD